jgi:thymidylate kinase
MLNKLIYITGPDGIGKTTCIDFVDRKLFNEQTYRVWIRSPKITSKPLMAYCRLVGLTRYKVIDGVEYGVHDFHKSSIVSQVFPLLQLMDFKLKWFLVKRGVRADDVLLIDRFNLDTLADLMVDTRRYDLHKTWIGKQFIKILPDYSQVFTLKVNEKKIRERKKDTKYDENLERKIEVYSILSKDLSLISIDNNKSLESVKNELIMKIRNV